MNKSIYFALLALITLFLLGCAENNNCIECEPKCNECGTHNYLGEFEGTVIFDNGYTRPQGEDEIDVAPPTIQHRNGVYYDTYYFCDNSMDSVDHFKVMRVYGAKYSGCSEDSMYLFVIDHEIIEHCPKKLEEIETFEFLEGIWNFHSLIPSGRDTIFSPCEYYSTIAFAHDSTYLEIDRGFLTIDIHENTIEVEDFHGFLQIGENQAIREFHNEIMQVFVGLPIELPTTLTYRLHNNVLEIENPKTGYVATYWRNRP